MMLSPSDHLRAIASIGTSESLLLQAPTSLDSSTISPRSTTTIIRDEQLDAYTMDVVNAVRHNDIARLRELLEQGHCLDACNTNGESLLHLACRRGEAATVQFLVSEAAVNVHWRDCLGRSVLHDLCWRATPAFDVMDVVLPILPPQLWWAVDTRGHSCWDYCRRSDWEAWNQYLSQRQELIAQRILLQLQQHRLVESPEEPEESTIEIIKIG